MKLTNTQRDAFIRAAMNDVPQIDYQEKNIKIIAADIKAQLPPKVLAIWEDSKLEGYVNLRKGYFGITYFQYPYDGYSHMKLSPKAEAAVDAIKQLNEAQDVLRDNLRNKLRGCAYACTTRKALLDLLPEFEKYLPADDVAACRTLPVVANVVSDFVKAGWPASRKAPAKTKPAVLAE